MAKYLISFPSAAMVVPDGEWEAVVRDSHAVIEEAKVEEAKVEPPEPKKLKRVKKVSSLAEINTL